MGGIRFAGGAGRHPGGLGIAAALAAVALLAACSIPPKPAPTPTPTPTATPVITGTPVTGGSSPSPTPEASPTTSATATPTAAPTATPGGSGSTPTPTPTGPALAITSLPWHAGEVSIAYGAVHLGAAGGTSPYSWSVAGGSFPGGLSLSGGGTVAGTPTSTGGGFTVQVADSAGHTALAATSIPISPYLSASGTCPNAGCTVESPCAICGTYGQQGGGVPPYTYNLVNGTLPTGTSLNGVTLAGPMSTPGGYSFSVQIVDALGASATIDNAYFTVIPHLVLKAGRGSGPTPNGPATVSMPLTINGPVSRITDDGGYQVGGYSYDPNGQVLTITLTGKFTTTPPPFNVTVYDSYRCGPPSANCSSTAPVTLSMG